MAVNPLHLFRDVATELAAEQPDALQWRSGLDLITTTIKEVTVLRRNQPNVTSREDNS